MTLFNLQIEQTFSKNVNKETTLIFKKQVIFFFTVLSCPMIHNIYLKRYCFLTLPLFLFCLHFPLTFVLKLE